MFTFPQIPTDSQITPGVLKSLPVVLRMEDHVACMEDPLRSGGDQDIY